MHRLPIVDCTEARCDAVTSKASSTVAPNLLPLLPPLTQAYSKEDTAKMPAELSSPLSSAREACVDEQLKADCADAVFLIVSQVGGIKRNSRKC